MPQLRGSSKVVGVVTKKATQQTGLIPGIPLIAGGLDAASGALGAGVVRPAQTNEQGGQPGGIGVSLDRVVVAQRAEGGEGGHGLGLYALTAYGIGLHPDIGTCVANLLPTRKVFEPVVENHAFY